MAPEKNLKNNKITLEMKLKIMQLKEREAERRLSDHIPNFCIESLVHSMRKSQNAKFRAAYELSY